MAISFSRAGEVGRGEKHMYSFKEGLFEGDRGGKNIVGLTSKRGFHMRTGKQRETQVWGIALWASGRPALTQIHDAREMTKF